MSDRLDDPLALIEAARAEVPPAAVRERIRAGLDAKLAAQGASQLAAQGASQLAAQGGSRLAPALGAATVAAVAIGLGLWLAFSPADPVIAPEADTPSAAKTPAPVDRVETRTEERADPVEQRVEQPVIERRALQRSRAVPRVKAPIAPEPAAEPALDLGDLEKEATLLAGARRAIAEGRAADALALVAEHEAQFPQGSLRDERRAAKTRALCALDRREEARAEAEALLSEAPRTPLRDQLECAMGDGR